MAIPIATARRLIGDFETPDIRNLFAQAHAKHVLQEVNEAPENFPAFDLELDDKVTFAVYALLAAGCSIAEQGERAEAASSLEQAASFLHYVHAPLAANSRESAFHALVAAMAFYAAGHYSRAFVAIRLVEQQTNAAKIAAAFLRKDVGPLIEALNEVLLRDYPEGADHQDLEEWAITHAIARAVSLAMEFIFTGAGDPLRTANNVLQEAAVIASAGLHPAWWWVMRLLRLMLTDLGETSPWTVLPPYFGPDLPSGFYQYVRLLAFAKCPVCELWVSQRAALPLALDQANRGAVINLRTSAGKTRVAELAILQTLLAEPASRVLYLAPFRSLALEVEYALSQTFSWLGFEVSHLYGGSRVSSVDTELAADSAITIATPEKARALLRVAPSLFGKVRLIVIDEGHLVGPSERYVRNEVFIDHLRSLARATGARIILLSAVLPNPQQLAEWVTGDKNAVATSLWKPSTERFGLLRWNGHRVRIDWLGGVGSFNPSFVEAGPLGFGRRRNPFPNDKNEAIAAAAVRLCKIGPVMIFTGRAVSVPTIAEALLLALGKEPQDHSWPEHEWKVFCAVCQEELAADAIELRAARAGVVCHSNRLTPQVRLALEHLMRSRPPKIIVATTTLAQGVNVGISSVIIATPYISQKTIDKRDFWNICGRAGRAFVDGEGKVLYAIDETRQRWQVEKDEELAHYYFDISAHDMVKSGLLFVLGELRKLAEQNDVSFDLLLELAASNDFSALGSEAQHAASICDCIDDELLALHEDSAINPLGEGPEAWVEGVFRTSLAAIQAREGTSPVGIDDVLAFLRTRAAAALRLVAPPARRAVISTGLPLSVALRAHDSTEFFREIADGYIAAEGSLVALVAAVGSIEDWARGNAASITGEMPRQDRLDAIRNGWLGGIALQKLASADGDAAAIVKDLYGYQLPWIIHAASQEFRIAEHEERADALARIALLLEVGVPTEMAARIYLAGVRSRVAATELARLGRALGTSVSDIKRSLRDTEVIERLRGMVSPSTAAWLDVLIAETRRHGQGRAPTFAPFTLDGADDAVLLHARRLGDQIWLCTSGGSKRIPVRSSDQLPFARVTNDPRFAFFRSGSIWKHIVRDPRLSAGDR